MNSLPGTPGSAVTPGVIKPISLGILALTLLIGAGCSSSPQTYLERGNRFADAGKYDDAILQYRKALQKAPNLGEAHYRLGLAELKKALPVQAYQALHRAAELLPGNDQVLAKLGELSIGLYNADPRHPKQFYDEAAKVADQLLRQNPDGFDANRLKGALALVDRKPAEAVEYMRKADKAKPGDRDTLLGLARALVSDNQAPAGVDLARGLIQKDKTFAPAYDFLFEQYEAARKPQDAEEILKLKVANNPKQADYLLELARYYVVTSNPGAMSSTLQKLLDDPADFPDSRMRVGDFYNSLGRFDDAFRLFQEGPRIDAKNKVSYQKKMVQVLSEQRKFPEAIQQVDTILKEQPTDQESKLFRALIWLDEGKPENLDPAIAELRAQVQLKPQDLILRYRLGLALSRKGDQEGARGQWALAARQSRSYLPPRFALASLDLAQGRPQEALQVSEEILAAAPANQEARILNAVCLTGVGRFPEARAKLNLLIHDSPQSLSARYQLGVLAISERKYQEAEAIFRQLQQATPDPRVIAGLVEAYQGENQSGRAVELLQDELKRSPNSQPLHSLLAQFASVSGNHDLAIEQYQQMAAANPKSVDIQIRLGAAYQAKGDNATAAGIFEKAAQADAKSVPAAMMLAQAFDTAGRSSEAKAAYRRVLALQPDEPRALNNLAFLMLETGENVDEALKLAQRGLQAVRDPGLKASLSDTVGWAYLKKKMYVDAVQTFQGLVQAHSENATFRYHLGAALFEKGDTQKARTELQAALAAKPKPADEPKIRELLARP